MRFRQVGSDPRCRQCLRCTDASVGKTHVHTGAVVRAEAIQRHLRGSLNTQRRSVSACRHVRSAALLCSQARSTTLMRSACSRARAE